MRSIEEYAKIGAAALRGGEASPSRQEAESEFVRILRNDNINVPEFFNPKATYIERVVAGLVARVRADYENVPSSLRNKI